MTVSSNYSTYASYSSSAATSNLQKGKPDFEAMAQEMLSSMDTDGNGSIDATEFTSALQSGSSEDVSASANDIFTRLDTNGDGGMSTEEFMAALQASRPEPPQGGGAMGSMPPPPSPPPPSDSTSSSESDSTELFSSLDTNKDGVISQDELMALFGQSSDQTAASDSPSSASNNETMNDIRTKMLQQILAYYGSASATETSSTLSISA